MLLNDENNIFDIYYNRILLEARDVIKSDDPKELLAKFITGSSLYKSNLNLKKEADSIATDIINQILQIQKQKGGELFEGKDLMSLINSLLMMSGTQQYVNQINGDESKINKNLYNRALPVLLHDYKDSLDKKEELLNNPQFSNLFQKGIPKWMDIVHSFAGKEKHKPQEIKKTETEKALFENDEVAVYLANDTENPINGVKRCKEFGKGTNLCISGSNASYHYHDYRWNDKLTTYFCYLKKRGHYMLVDVDEDGELQYNPMTENEDISISKEELLKLYPELTEPFENNVFNYVRIRGRELEFYQKFYDLESILELKNTEDRVTFASFKDIKPEEWNGIPKEEWNKILEKAIYVTEKYDIPDYVFEGKPRLHKQYLQNVKRRVELQVSEWTPDDYDYEDGLDFTPNQLYALKDVENFSNSFLENFGSTMWFLSLKKDDPKFNKNINKIVQDFLNNRKHQINENGVVILDRFVWPLKYVLFPFNLVECGDMNFEYATVVSLPFLKKSGNITAHLATNLELPQLKESGDIGCEKAITITLPQLEKSENILFEEIRNLSLPKLKYCKSIFCRRTLNLSLPELIQSGAIYASLTQTLSLPELVKSGKISSNSIRSLHLPQLKESGDIDCEKAAKIELPQLKESGYIRAHNANIIYLPKLQELKGDYVVIYSSKLQKITISRNLIKYISGIDLQNLEIVEPTEQKEKLNDSVIYNLIRSLLLKS
jgi:hypothetical protein